MHIARRLLKLASAVMPPPQWRLPVIIVVGIFCGLGLHVLHISRAFSYLSDKPEVCMNCHVMTTQFATWERGNHGYVTNCNGCHVPQNNVALKYAFKAIDGLRHSAMFAMRMEPQVIRIKKMGAGAVQNNCLRCHERTVMNLSNAKEENCWRCHRETPHGRINSLSATPFARVPRLNSFQF